MNKTLIRISLVIGSLILLNPISAYANEELNREETKIINESNNKGNSTEDNDKINVGWKQDKEGNKILLDGKGNMVKSSWCEVGGQWYYFDDNGIMKTGWLKNEENWYHLNPNGILDLGWINDKGQWYYSNSNGKMQIGWQYINDKWYYFNQDGVMQYNTEIDGYYLGANGVML